ncbi:MAG: hypothetical protein U5J83_07175 [Bryobacterales bacterium]|nr:hypothetical protein [Bryobacterales bacterium]
MSSRQAKPGDSVLFVTEQAVEIHSGQHVPAGALVEGVIAKAKPSSVQTPGRLVIEIRALHVGSQAFPLHALPYIPKNATVTESVQSVEGIQPVDIRALGIRTQLRVNPEAVMPKETVIEFQLVEVTPGENPLRNLPEPDSPLPSLELRPATPSLPAVSPAPPAPDAKPSSPLRRNRIATDRG